MSYNENGNWECDGCGNTLERESLVFMGGIQICDFCISNLAMSMSDNKRKDLVESIIMQN